jgi:general secretion pathway protein G
MLQDENIMSIRSRRSRGFTMIELMVVLSIIVIFMGIAVPMFNRSILRAREETLRSDLTMLNRQIVQYTIDKQKAPQSLDDLKTAGYIEQIPNDPITGEPNWEVEQEEFLLSVEQQDPGITGVHSASSAISTNGDAYSTW